MRENLSRGPAFADYLDDLTKYSLRLSVSNPYQRSIYLHEDAVEIYDINQIFPPFHLIKFKRPYSGDILLLLKERVKVDPYLLEEFKEKAREFVSRDYKPIEYDDLDFFKFLSQSTCFGESHERDNQRKVQGSMKTLST
jgi:hypothetical protein